MAPDEACRLCRQVVGQLRIVQRAQGRELGSQPFRMELENLLRMAKILQAVRAEVAQRGAGRERVTHHAGRRLR